MASEEYKEKAWHDGWAAAGEGRNRHEWTYGCDHDEREAFKAGWDARAERVAMGYDLPPGWVEN